jgi:hypothetical protein
VPIVLKSGSLNLLEPSGPVKAVMGLLYLFYSWAVALIEFLAISVTHTHTHTHTHAHIYIYTVKPVKLATLISWPPAYVGHVSVEPAKSHLVCI